MAEFEALAREYDRLLGSFVMTASPPSLFSHLPTERERHRAAMSTIRELREIVRAQAETMRDAALARAEAHREAQRGARELDAAIERARTAAGCGNLPSAVAHLLGGLTAARAEIASLRRRAPAERSLEVAPAIAKRRPVRPPA